MSTEPDSIWGGYFAFVNRLGQDIVRGTAKHWTTDFGTESIDLSGLADGQTSVSKAFTTSTTNTDRWAFKVTLSYGESYSVGQKDCGFETGDSGKTVQLQAFIAGGSHTFYISMPSTSDCSTSF